MRYIFDSDTISYLYNPKSHEHESIKARFVKLTQDDVIQISDITLFELEYSYYNSPAPTKKQEIRITIEDIKKRYQILPIKNYLAGTYGEIKVKLRKVRGTSSKGMKKHNIDLIVASTAICESSILVANDDIYADLAKLNSQFQYENWAI